MEVPYDPFGRGPFPVGVRSVEALDVERSRQFPIEVWYPAAAQYAGQDLLRATQDVFTDPLLGTPRAQTAVREATARGGTWPLILFSHSSGNDRRQSTGLCAHLASHGYLVTALDHSERVAAELAPRGAETDAQKRMRWDAVIAARVPDLRFLLEQVRDTLQLPGVQVDLERVGVLGHSFGGWTALAAVEALPVVRAVVALAPAGASERRPGILPVELAFAWGRDVPTLYLVAEADTSLPLAGMIELFDRTPASKRMVILRRADHMHFMDGAEELHEWVRAMPGSPEFRRLQQEMQPIGDLCSGEQAGRFTRGLAVAHLDAVLNELEGARRFWTTDIEAELRSRDIDAAVHRP